MQSSAGNISFGLLRWWGPIVILYLHSLLLLIVSCFSILRCLLLCENGRTHCANEDVAGNLQVPLRSWLYLLFLYIFFCH